MRHHPVKKYKIKPLDFILTGLIISGLVFIFLRIRLNLRYEWAWDIIPKYILKINPETGRLIPAVILQGLILTVKLSIWGIISGLLIGTVFGIAGSGKNLFGRIIRHIYVGFVRNIPPIVLVFIFYFFFSSQILDNLGIEKVLKAADPGVIKLITIIFIKPSLLNEFFSAALSLAIYEGAYITEIIRAGIESVPKGQIEAAKALGMSPLSRLRHIILPQAVTQMLPPLSGQFISTIKDSAIVSVISIPELTFQGLQVMASTYATFEIWIVITVIYLILTGGCSLIFERIFSGRKAAGR